MIPLVGQGGPKIVRVRTATGWLDVETAELVAGPVGPIGVGVTYAVSGRRANCMIPWHAVLELEMA